MTKFLYPSTLGRHHKKIPPLRLRFCRDDKAMLGGRASSFDAGLVVALPDKSECTDMGALILVLQNQ
jgi:hypothetical protein